MRVNGLAEKNIIYFRKGISERLKVVDYFCKKTLSEIFDRVLNTEAVVQRCSV